MIYALGRNQDCPLQNGIPQEYFQVYIVPIYPIQPPQPLQMQIFSYPLIRGHADIDTHQVQIFNTNNIGNLHYKNERYELAAKAFDKAVQMAYVCLKKKTINEFFK